MLPSRCVVVSDSEKNNEEWQLHQPANGIRLTSIKAPEQFNVGDYDVTLQIN
jgi:hypothetical protein